MLPAVQCVELSGLHGERPAASRRSRSLGRSLVGAGLILVVLTSGCAARRAEAYRLEGPPDLAVLTPPPPKMTPEGEAIQLRRGPEHRGCNIENPVMGLMWHGSKASLIPHSAAMRDMSNVEADRHLQEFRVEVFRLQARGCFRAGDVNRLFSALAASLPLPPAMAFALRYGPSMATGYVDLIAGFRLEETTVIKTAAGQPAGQRTAWYKVEGRADSGVRVVPVGKPKVVWYPGRSATPPPPLGLDFPGDAQEWRLAWWLSASRADHFNMVIAAVSHSALDSATKHLDEVPADCTQVGTKVGGTWCAPLSRDTELTAELPVEVQGSPVYLPFTSTVSNAMRSAKILNPAEVLPHLKVWRRYGGKLCPVQFDPGSDSILRLTLMAGDKLEW